MAETVIQVRVLRRNPRAQEILDALGRSLGIDDLEPDRSGAIPLRVHDRGPRAWERVRDALDDAGSDWRQWIHQAPRPSK